MKILMGLSGGVDSCFASRLLSEAGHAVEGAFLRMTAEADAKPAERAAAELGIPLHILDCRELFEEHVLKPFTESYMQGRTPNPCVECNRYVKIRVLCDFAAQNGFDRVATGHYGRIGQGENGRYFVRRSENEKKDQSYMLWGLTQEQLAMLTLPLENRDKEKLKQQAEKEGFSAAGQKESMDICFLPQGGYVPFVEKREGVCPPGDFVDPEGRVLGRHKGIVHYTVGQRKHLGIALGQKMFVAVIDKETNRVTLVPGGGEFSSCATVGSLRFQALEPMDEGELSGIFVKLRYAQKPSPARVRISGGRAELQAERPWRAVTPGQSAVFYDEDGRLLFGGYIEK